jgi:hypothetical protein
MGPITCKVDTPILCSYMKSLSYFVAVFMSVKLKTFSSGSNSGFEKFQYCKT